MKKYNKGRALSKIEGFTLIEMLVVIAMIGLLSAVVLVALGPSRNKAKDTRVISDINQARAIMEAEYNPVSNTYKDLPSADATVSLTAPALGSLAADVSAQGGTLKVTVANIGSTNDYAFYSALPSDSTTGYCIDSQGNTSSSTAPAAKSGKCTP